MDIPAVLDFLTPGASWGWLGEDTSDYSNLDWRDDIIAKPAYQDIVVAWPTVQAEIQADEQALEDADIAFGDSKTWFGANPNGKLLFTLFVAELEAEIDSLGLSAKETLLLKSLAMAVRVLARQAGLVR